MHKTEWEGGMLHESVSNTTFKQNKEGKHKRKKDTNTDTDPGPLMHTMTTGFIREERRGHCVYMYMRPPIQLVSLPYHTKRTGAGPSLVPAGAI